MVLSSSAGSWAGQDLAQRLVAAPTAFVGRVSYAENYGGLSYLKLTVTESIRNAPAVGAPLDLLSDIADNCDLRFQVDQLWLIFARPQHVGYRNHSPDGSLLLTEADGTPDCVAWRAAAALLSDTFRAAIPPTCR